MKTQSTLTGSVMISKMIPTPNKHMYTNKVTKNVQQIITKIQGSCNFPLGIYAPVNLSVSPFAYQHQICAIHYETSTGYWINGDIKF